MMESGMELDTVKTQALLEDTLDQASLHDGKIGNHGCMKE
jgi:hypothetical protein